MNSNILSTLRICVEQWTSHQAVDTKYIWLQKKDSYIDILKKATSKFGISFEKEGYVFYIKKHLCKITTAEDLIHDDIIIMLPKNSISKSLRYLDALL